MTFTRTFDYGLVRSIMTEPKVYRHITDDSSPPAAEFHPIEHEAVWYVVVHDGDELLGLWMFVPQNTVCWEVHTCLLPSAWGERGHVAAQAMSAWVWANTPCRRILTNVPAYNRLALRFAEAAGMRQFGVNERSYMKHGKLHDQILLGLSPPESTCQQQQQ